MTTVNAVQKDAALARTPNQRKQAERVRMRKLGFKQASFWIHPDDFAALRKYVDRKNAAR